MSKEYGKKIFYKFNYHTVKESHSYTVTQSQQRKERIMRAVRSWSRCCVQLKIIWKAHFISTSSNILIFEEDEGEQNFGLDPCWISINLKSLLWAVGTIVNGQQPLMLLWNLGMAETQPYLVHFNHLIFRSSNTFWPKKFKLKI